MCADRQRRRAAQRGQRLAVARMRCALQVQCECVGPRFVVAVAPVAHLDGGVFRGRRHLVGTAHRDAQLRQIRRARVEVAQFPLRRDRRAVASGQREEKREEKSAAHGGS